MAQNPITGQDSVRRVITTAVPFIGIAPDSRATGMGDAGVATSPDANSAQWNNGKLAFVENGYGFSISYSPWLANIVPDMGLAYLSGFYKIDRVQTVGASMRYFDLGQIHLTNIFGDAEGTENPREAAFDATYSRKLTENLGIGVTMRYIWSNLVGSVTGGVRPGKSFSADLGVYYTRDLQFGPTPSTLSFGAHFSNIGQKISYLSEEQASFIPINLRIGSALDVDLDPFNSLTFALDFNKLLVPTPPVYERNENGQVQQNNGRDVILRGKDPNRNLLAGMFGSFTDAPDGFQEELQEIMIAAGAEYWYRDAFAGRIGYFHEHTNKGGRKYLTLGLGFRYQTFGIDFSYLVPGNQNNPLAETIRFSLIFNFENMDSQSENP